MGFNGDFFIVGDFILYEGDVFINLFFVKVFIDNNLINVRVNVKNDVFKIVNILID